MPQGRAAALDCDNLVRHSIIIGVGVCLCRQYQDVTGKQLQHHYDSFRTDEQRDQSCYYICQVERGAVFVVLS